MEEFENAVPQENETPAPTETEEKQPLGRGLYDWVSSLAAAVLIIALTFTFVVRMMGVEGTSMVPTLQDGDRLIVLNAMFCGDYRPGEVVIARKESFSRDPIVKRVIAVGGQTVDIDFSRGIVYVDGEALEESYINERTFTPEGVAFPLTVPEGSVLLMGDNRNHSTDSRSILIGTVDTRYLIGKVKLLVFPGPDSVTRVRSFSRVGIVK